MDIVQLRRLLQ